MWSNKGLSLIEVLIVIAIISVLAATAIPMYLESQVRAKVAAALSDMRQIAFALETYHADHETYVPSFTYGRMLTTPVAYLSQMPRDAFPTNHRDGTAPDDVGKNEWNDMRWFEFFSAPDGVEQKYIDGAYNHYYQTVVLGGIWVDDFQRGMSVPTQKKWVIRSDGPDKQFNWYLRYDPTNGTVSPGDICRFGP